MFRVIALLPLIEGPGRDAKLATNKSGIVIIVIIVGKPFESLPGLFR